MNPYELLDELRSGPDFKYINDTTAVFEARGRAEKLQKLWPLAKLAVPAYRFEGYDQVKASSRKAELIGNWLAIRYAKLSQYAELQLEFTSFLSGANDCFAIPTSFGPPNQETMLVRAQLEYLVNYGFLTWDSQPGVLVEQDDGPSYVQRPYVYISGASDDMARLLTTLKKVQYHARPAVLLADQLGVYEPLKQRYDLQYLPVGQGLGPKVYLARYLASLPLQKEIAGHALVVLVAECWYVPFFTILADAASGTATDLSKIENQLGGY